jgi:DNA helicase II / ATP-dependent DNA helicase PcrA
MAYPLFFQKIIDGLNVAQKAAVDKIEGPVMVIAGPGTGKTHILAARIGKILLDTDTRPESILCLTYTDAGVYAMRQRLVKYLGPTAHKINIHTFHSFCNMVIMEHPEKFGRMDMRPITDLERIEIIQEILDSIPGDSPLVNKYAGKYAYESQCRHLFQLMKSENWTSGLVVERIDAYIEGLSSNEDYLYKRDNKIKDIKKGQPNWNKINEKIDRLTRTKVAALFFDDYLMQLQKRGLYEFADMINWVSAAFRENEGLLQDYQERFLYFLVDEFQDTNGAQTEILNLLVDYWDSPNVFIVGDDDQSIYEFQGARLENLASFYERFSRDLRVIVLDENYRSSQEILDSAGKVIDKNNLRAIHRIGEGHLAKVLTAADRALAALKGGIRLEQYEDKTQEIIGLKKRIKELKKSGVQLSEIAILFSKNKDGIELAASLKRSEIPFQIKRPEDALQYYPIEQVIKILAYLEREVEKPFSGEHLLFEILHYDFFGLKASDIARWSLSRKLLVGLPKNFREWFMGESHWSQIGLAAPGLFDKVGEVLDQLMKDRFNLPTHLYIEAVLQKTGFMQTGLQRDDHIYFIQAVKGFLQFIRELSDRTPFEILEIIGKMKKHRLSIPIHILSGKKEAVQLLTAHSSKGLEFEYVFLFNLVESEWSKKSGNGIGRFSLPENLVPMQEADFIEARRRLFYVAMTRARKGLNFSYSGNKGTEFIDEALEGTGIEPQRILVNEEELLEENRLELSVTSDELNQDSEEDLVARFLENWTMSASSLSEYLRCPRSFYYNIILGVPTESNEAMTYGWIIHKALELYFKNHQKLELNGFTRSDELIQFFEEEMKMRAGLFSKQGYDVFMALGRRDLEAYYAHSCQRWGNDFVVEHDITKVVVCDIPMGGKLDKFEIEADGRIQIVDYKTSKYDLSKISPPSENQLYGGDYWRQMWFYKTIFEAHDSGKRKVSGAIIEYTGHTEKKEQAHLELRFNPDEESIFLEMVESTYQKIRSRQFSDGCEDKQCRWCQFVIHHG